MAENDFPAATPMGFVRAVAKRSMKDWHDGEGYFALSAYVIIFLLPFLVTGTFAKIIGEVANEIIARLAVMWLAVLFLVITPYRLWRDQIGELLGLKGKLENRAARTKALGSLGDTWEKSVHYLNDIVKQGTYGDVDAEKIEALSAEIYEAVNTVSPGEVSTFRTIRSYNETEHPREYWAASWGGEKALVIFSERLRRVQLFIGKHTPPLFGGS